MADAPPPPDSLARARSFVRSKVRDILSAGASADARRSIRNALFNSSEYLIGLILWFAATPFFMARLGPEQYGIWMLVNAVVGLGGLVSFGLTDATVRYMAKYRALQDARRVGRVLGTTFTLNATLGAVASLSLCAAAPWLVDHVFNIPAARRGVAVAAFRIGGAGLLARFVHAVFQSALYGFERYDLAGQVGIGLSAVTVGSAVILLGAGYGLAAVLWSGIAIVALASLAQAIILKRRLAPGIPLRPTLDRAIVREVAGFGFFTWFQGMLSLVMQNMDLFLIGALLNPTAVARYSVASKMPMQVHVLLSRASAFLFPFSGALHEKGDRQRLRRVFDKATVVVTLLTSGVILPMYALGHNFLRLWMGREFADASTFVLQILCLRFAVLPVSIVIYHCVLGTGLVRVQAAVAVLCSAANLAGMLILIPRFGPVGAALGLLWGLPVTLLFRNYACLRLFGDPDWLGTACHVLPVLAPFAALTLLTGSCALPELSWGGLAVALGISSAAAMTVTAGLLTLLRRWLPAYVSAQQSSAAR